jgi:N,N'-diacetyllegionaminate synthase
MEIGGRKLGPDEPTLIVAEIGNNHDGSVGQAKALVEAAAEAGADAVKFQTHIAEAEMLPSTPTPPHFDEPRFVFVKRMELSLEAHRELKAVAEERKLLFFSSPFSVEAVHLLEQLDVPAYKIASGEVTNPPLVEAVAATGRPVLVSTGMSGLDEIAGAVAILRAAGSRFLVLQCTSAYPCPPEDVNLRAMKTLAERFDCLVGLSDHTPDVYTSIAAAALGAVCVEKHFTLSKRLYGPDHHASLEPEELKRLVEGIRQVEAALGSGEKTHDPAYDAVRTTFEKSVVTATTVPEGTPIQASMLTTKRPGNGIPAVRIADVIGRRAARELEPNHLLQEADLA